MQSNEHDISTLNGLIETTVDSVDGYRRAAEQSDNKRFRSIFMERADERDDVVTHLQEQVRKFGGTPEDSGTILAGAHRVFMSLGDTVTGGSDKSTVDEVERGEDHIKAKFEAAIANQEIAPETLAVIRQCYASIKEGHDQMRDLKHDLAATSTL